MMYLVLDHEKDERDWAWLKLRAANEWLYTCYFTFDPEKYSEDWMDRLIDDARWQRKNAVARIERLGIICDPHHFEVNERGHHICTRCHFFSVLVSLR